MAAITVQALAMIAGAARGIAMLERVVLVLVRVQLLDVSGDEQQAVVGARAEHQHQQQRGRDARDLQARSRRTP